MEEFKNFLRSFNSPTNPPPPPSSSNPTQPIQPIPPPIRCPFCLLENPYQPESRDCSSCGRESPVAYIKEFSETKPLWVHTVGFTGHGKSVYLSLLLSYIEKMSYLWSNAYYRPLNDDALGNIQANRNRINNGIMPEKTNVADFPIPVLMQLKNMKRWKDRCLIMHDLAGENYGTIQKTSEAGKFISFASTSLFMISLEEIVRVNSHKVSDLFDIYLSALERMNSEVVGRNIVVVYTKADILTNLPDRVSQYLQDDHLWSGLLSLKRQDFSESHMEEYIQYMNYISNQLREYTIDKIDGGLQLIHAAEGKGITLRFCVTSALGSPTDSHNTMIVPISPKRVLDPLFWIMELDQRKKLV